MRDSSLAHNCHFNKKTCRSHSLCLWSQLLSEDDTKGAGRTSKFQMVLISGFAHWNSGFKTYLPAFKTQNTAPTTHIVAYSDNNMVLSFAHWSFIQTSWLIPLGWCHQEDLKSGPCSQGEGKRLQTSHWSQADLSLNVNWYFYGWDLQKVSESQFTYLWKEKTICLTQLSILYKTTVCVCVCVCVWAHTWYFEGAQEILLSPVPSTGFF